MIRKLRSFLSQYFALLIVLAAYGWASLTILLHRHREQPAETITLRIGHWQLEASVREAIDFMARKYREEVNPRVVIIQDAIPEGVYPQWIGTQLMGGTAPDMLQVGLGNVPNNIWISYYNRYFLPLGRSVERANPHNRGTDLENIPVRRTYKDGMRTSYVDEMQDYMSVPQSLFGVRIFYNKGLLRKLTGLAAPPKEYRAFLAACERIRAQKNERGEFYTPIAGSGYHYAWWDGMMFDPLTYGAVRKADFNRDASVGNDELFVAFKMGLIDLQFPAYRAKFRMLREVTDQFQPGYTGLTRDEAVFLFAQQRAVFMTTGTWDARNLQKQAEGQFEVGVMDFPLPTREDPEYGSIVEGPIYERPGGGFTFAVTRTSQHPDIALDFLLFMASQKRNEELNRIIGWIPCILGTKMDPLLESFAPHLEGVYGAFPITLGGETMVRWGQLFSAYQIGQISYDELAREYTDFYLKNGMKDFLEQQRDWRRGMHQNERFLAAIRAQALSASGGEAVSAWIRYRALTASRQVWTELNHSRQMKLLEKGPDSAAVGPYEYSPAVIEKIRGRIRDQAKAGGA